MKIGILTHHTVINQGAILQMYALRSWLESKGHDVYILKYTKDFDFAPNEAGKYNLSLKYFPFYFREYVVKKGIGLSWFNVQKQLMYKKYIANTFKFRNYATDEMDAVIVGSDEVFSLAAGCNMMMYGHGVATDNLIAYAPSFGQTDLFRIEKYHCKELISSGLKKFKSLSVRDTNSAEIVHVLIGTKPMIVCDPVMLYDFSDEHEDIRRFGLTGKKYILIYSMDRWMVDPAEITSIKEYAYRKGYITVSAGTYHKWCDKNIVCNPIEWLEIFRGATEVITDTFHGSILSIITNRPAFFCIRDLNSNKLSSLYKSFGLEHRVVKKISVSELERLDTNSPIDFVSVNQKLMDLRNTSELYLNNALSFKE